MTAPALDRRFVSVRQLTWEIRTARVRPEVRRAARDAYEAARRAWRAKVDAAAPGEELPHAPTCDVYADAWIATIVEPTEGGRAWMGSGSSERVALQRAVAAALEA